MDSLEVTDAIGENGSTHARVSLADIEGNIQEEVFFTAGEADGAIYQRFSNTSPLNILTLCIIVLNNGFCVVGKSAPASPENFDKEKGRIFAREDAIRQIWPLMGFALRDRLYSARHDPNVGPTATQDA